MAEPAPGRAPNEWWFWRRQHQQNARIKVQTQDRMIQGNSHARQQLSIYRKTTSDSGRFQNPVTHV